jgi:hypothetical protein
MNHAKTSFSTEICADAIISVVQYLALLRQIKRGSPQGGLPGCVQLETWRLMRVFTQSFMQNQHAFNQI